MSCEEVPMSPTKENLPTLPEQLQKEVMEGKDHLKRNEETVVKNVLPTGEQIAEEKKYIADEQNKTKDRGSKVMEQVNSVDLSKLNHVEPNVKNILPDTATIAQEKVRTLIQHFDQRKLSKATTDEKSGDPVGKVLW